MNETRTPKSSLNMKTNVMEFKVDPNFEGKMAIEKDFKPIGVNERRQMQKPIIKTMIRREFPTYFLSYIRS